MISTSRPRVLGLLNFQDKHEIIKVTARSVRVLANNIESWVAGAFRPA